MTPYGVGDEGNTDDVASEKNFSAVGLTTSINYSYTTSDSSPHA